MRPTPTAVAASHWRTPTPQSVISAIADFWLAWLCISTALTLFHEKDGASPGFILGFALEGIALTAERFLTVGGWIRTEDELGRFSWVRFLGASVESFLAACMLWLWGSLSLAALLLLIILAPREALGFIMLLGRRVWRGYANRPRNATELGQRREWWRLEQRIHWVSLLIAAGVAMGTAAIGRFSMEGATGEAVSLVAFSAYFAVVGLYVIFRDPRTEARHGSKTPRVASVSTVPPFQWATVKDAFTVGYWHLIPGILFIVFTQEVLLLAVPEEGQGVVWPVCLLMSVWLLAAGSLKAQGRVKAIPDLASRCVPAITTGLLFWIGGLIWIFLGGWFALSLAGWKPADETFPFRAIPLLIVFMGFGLYLVGRLWPAYINPFIYKATWRGRSIHLPGIAAAWRMTSGAASWRHATFPLLTIGVFALGPLSGLLVITDAGLGRFLIKALLYGVGIPVATAAAVDRAWVMRLPGVAGVEEERGN